MNLTTIIPAGAIAILSSVLLSSCGNMNPGGLSDEQWSRLSPSRQAELRMQQNANTERQIHDSQESAHWNKQDNRNSNYDLNRSLERRAESDLNRGRSYNSKKYKNESVGEQLRDAGL